MFSRMFGFKKDKILTFYGLWCPQFWPETKNNQNSFFIIFYELSNAFPLLAMTFRSRVRRGRNPPPPARGDRRRASVWRGLRSSSLYEILSKLSPPAELGSDASILPGSLHVRQRDDGSAGFRTDIPTGCRTVQVSSGKPISAPPPFSQGKPRYKT